jgi:predicted lysophospholipase L1 biosynthesis ABC-type transport system permease subunit
MERYGYAIGALLGLLLPALVIVLIAARAEEMPWVASAWPLLAALATSVVTWCFRPSSTPFSSGLS